MVIAAEQAKQKQQSVTITAPNIQVANFKIVGTAPYVQLRFSQKALGDIRDKHEAGPTAKGKKVRKARDFAEDYRNAVHVSEDGWIGIPASAFRAAMISACRLVNFKMTLAKLSVFVKADGIDKVDGTPLIRIEGKPEPLEGPVRNATGVIDLRVRALWRTWSAVVGVRFDADQFTLQDVSNLMSRVGEQVGIGEGRPDSRESAGMGWGTFEIEKSRIA